MSRIAIRAEGLGKAYRIGTRRASYRTLRESLVGSVRDVLRRGSGKAGIFWALRDVSFELEAGQALGIIGHNGAGKSTLLKILSRVTEPTEGRAVLNGRVGTLLEVGTGFHPELTGRENVYLSGAILGMRRAEIDRKFDAIVAFSGVEEFLDTPVKRYSSGMYVRLAFSVAAHLEPEILVVDEVLAVGDTAFQQQCLGKMGEVAGEGRTVLLVSHNLSAISRLCTRALVLEHGRSRYYEKVGEAIASYVGNASGAQQSRVDLRGAPRDPANRQEIVTAASLHRADGSEAAVFSTGETMVVRLRYRVERELLAHCQINVSNFMRERLLTVINTHSATPLRLVGDGEIECAIPDIRLLSGHYWLDFQVGSLYPYQWLDYIPSAMPFRVEIGDYLGGMEVAQGAGLLAQRSHWRTTDRTLAPDETRPAPAGGSTSAEARVLEGPAT